LFEDSGLQLGKGAFSNIQNALDFASSDKVEGDEAFEMPTRVGRAVFALLFIGC
jgi:hypothetical protein